MWKASTPVTPHVHTTPQRAAGGIRGSQREASAVTLSKQQSQMGLHGRSFFSRPQFTPSVLWNRPRPCVHRTARSLSPDTHRPKVPRRKHSRTDCLGLCLPEYHSPLAPPSRPGIGSEKINANSMCKALDEMPTPPSHPLGYSHASEIGSV